MGRAAALKVYFEEEKPWELNDQVLLPILLAIIRLICFYWDRHWSFSVIVNRNDRENNQAVDYSKATIEVSNAEGNLTVEIAYNTEKIAIPNVIQWKVPNAKVEQAYQVRIRNVRVRGTYAITNIV